MRPTFDHINRHGLIYSLILLFIIIFKPIFEVNGFLPTPLDTFFTLVIVFFLYAFVKDDRYQPARTKTDKFFKVLYYVVIWMNLFALFVDMTIKITINN